MKETNPNDNPNNSEEQQSQVQEKEETQASIPKQKFTPPRAPSKTWLSPGVKLSLKLFFLLFLMMVLLIPKTMITGLVRERDHRSQEAARDVMSSWGGAQTIIGPLVKIPYEVRYEESVSSGKNSETKTRQVWKRRYFYLSPEALHIQGQLESKLLKRSIYSIPVYQSQVELSGHFIMPLFKAGEEPIRILWPEATLQMGIKDLKGIRGHVNVDWKDKSEMMGPQFSEERLLNSALEMATPLGDQNQTLDPNTSSETRGNPYDFKIQIPLAGGKFFEVVPLGKQTTLKLSSNWPHPSFSGSFLPTERQITPKGFSARWSIAETSRNLPSLFKKGGWSERALEETAFGVSLVDPVDHYSLSDRATKYASLFILMSFVAFFLFEVLGKLKIHPLQYLMVGLALVLFYLLLLSFAEHVGFGFAYLIAASANVLVLSGYLATILKNKKHLMLMALMWSGLYAYLYTLLKLEDFALLAGSVGLFMILSLVMFLTRKIDWYRLGNHKKHS